MDFVKLNWAKRNLTRLNKEECRVLQLRWNNPTISTDGMISPAKQDLHVMTCQAEKAEKVNSCE